MIPARISWFFGIQTFSYFYSNIFIQLKFDFYRCFLKKFIILWEAFASHISIYFSTFIREFYLIFRTLSGIQKFYRLQNIFYSSFVHFKDHFQN